jgi:hypothetical protein
MLFPEADIRELRERVDRALRQARKSPWLVGYDVNAIQELVTAGSRPITMRGASDTIAAFDRDERDQPRTVFAGGGRGISVVGSRAEAERLTRELPSKFGRVSVVGVMAAATVPLERNPVHASLRWLRHKLELAKDEAPRPGGQLPEARTKECDNCQSYQATRDGMRDGRPEHLCDRCHRMMHVVRRDSESQEMSNSLLDVAASDPNPRHRRSVAAVSADGNNLGALFDNIETLEELAATSEAVGRIFRAAHERALEAARAACRRRTVRPTAASGPRPDRDHAGEIRTVPLMTGGDDVRAFLPASGLLAYAETLAATIEEHAGQLGDLGGLLRPHTARALGQLGVGIGAVVGGDHYPARRLMQYAHELEVSAKTRCGAGRARSALDVEIITNEQTIDLDADVRRPETDGRPFVLGGQGWADTCARARGLHEIPTAQRALLAEARALAPEEFDNLFRYQVARSRAWQRWYETYGVADWRDPRAVIAERPGAGLLTLAALLPEEAP